MKSVLCFVFVLMVAMAAYAQDQAGATKPADDKLMVTPGLPNCLKSMVMSGDPSAGAYVIYAKASAGCVVPTHWHTAKGQLVWVSGTGRLMMKDANDQTVGPGMFVTVPAKHQHSERCVTTCAFYAMSDQAFDIHYVDASGNEIPSEQALAAKKPAAQPKK